MSPISSRKRVPPSARSNVPARASTPVATPRSMPKSSASSSDSGSAAQLMATKALSLREAALVHAARDDFLARTALAGDEDVGRRVGDALGQLNRGEKGPARADESGAGDPLGERLAQVA
jgi:hypothetical protein